MNNYLVHHGIKGQKWGIRNGPPYPLDSDQNDEKVNLQKEIADLATNYYIKRSAFVKARNELDDVWDKIYDLPHEKLISAVQGDDTELSKQLETVTREFLKTQKESDDLYNKISNLVYEQLKKKEDLTTAEMVSKYKEIMEKLDEPLKKPKEEIEHSGILGQKWGHRNGPPYPLDQEQKSKEERRLERADKRFIKKNDKKIRRYAEKATKKQMREYDKQLRQMYRTKTRRGKVARNYATAYSKILADLMNTAIGDIPAPSGRVVKFVAKRGEIGVFTALADRGYDMSQLKNGVYDSGKVAYRKQEVSKMNMD